VGQSSVTRVLVVARKGSQDPVGASLKRAGYAVRSADSPLAATRLLGRDRPDVVVIHEHALNRRELEDLSAAAAQQEIPALLVSTAEGSDLVGDRLSERIESLLAKGGSHGREGGGNERLSIGALVIDLDRHTALLHGRALSLTAKEFDLLWQLARMAGRVLSRQQLMDLVWGHDYVDPRVVTVHLANLRKKLAGASAEAPASPGSPSVLIEAVRGVGYRLAAPEPATESVLGSGPGAALAAAARPTGGHSLRTPFVGREGELSALCHSLDAACEGEVQLVAIAGEAGIGKTRLAQELSDHARRRGVGVYWGRCHDSRDGPAYEPWVEVFNRWEREGLPTDLTGVLEQRSSDSRGLERQAESCRRELLEKMLAVVRWKAEQRPICVVLEDLHWADPSTLAILQHGVRYLHDVPLLLLLTYRPDEGDAASQLSAIVAEVTRADAGLAFRLAPLGRTEVARLVGECEAGKLTVGPVEQLVADLYDLTDGNPFYLTQVMRLLLLHSGETGLRVSDLDLSRDVGVSSVILQRLSRLTPFCREWLEAAAVFGREFTGFLVSETVKLPPDMAAHALLDALDNRLVLPAEEAPERYRFVHSLVRDVLYRGLPPQRRALLHARAGAVLETLCADELDRNAARLAYHYSAAADTGCAAKAVEYGLRAGRVAASQYAWEEACSHWRRALSLLEVLPEGAPERRPLVVARVYEDMGDAYQLSAQPDRAAAAYEDAAARLSPSGDRVWLARLKRKQVVLAHLLGRDPDGLALVKEAESLLGAPAEAESSDWWREWLEVKAARASLHYWANEAEAARVLLDGMTPAVEAHATPHQRAEHNQLKVLVELDSRAFVATPEAVASAEACAEYYLELGSPGDLQGAEQILSLAYLHSPEHREKAHRHLMRALEMSTRQHDVIGRMDALHQLSCWHRWRGEVEKVRECASEILSLVETEERQSTTHVVANARANLGWVAHREGRNVEARELAQGALEVLEGHSLCEWQARWPLLGLAVLDGDWDEVARQAGAMLHDSQMQMPDDLRGLLLRVVGEDTQAGPPSAGLIEALTATARAYGYL